MSIYHALEDAVTAALPVSNLHDLASPDLGEDMHHASLSREDSLSASDADEKRSQMEQTLKRTVTIVFWYKANTSPIRLYHSIPTFPLFQLESVPQLVFDLGLQPGTYIDAYSPLSGDWEQHFISTVREVVTEQRLLYKTRKTLIEGLDDAACPGLADELDRQRLFAPLLAAQTELRLNANGKRPLVAPDAPPRARPAPAVLSFDQYLAAAATYALPDFAFPAGFPEHAPGLPEPSASPQLGPGSSRASSKAADGTPEPRLVTAPAYQPYPPTSQEIPYHPHPPLKRWPNDFTVQEIGDGFDRMDALMAGTPGPCAAPGVTQRVAFERVFGSRYVKSTLTRHRNVWRKADQALKDSYAHRTDENAYWGVFVKCVDGRTGRRAEWTARRQTLLERQAEERDPGEGSSMGPQSTPPFLDEGPGGSHMLG